MNRISDEILTMHGFKGIGNSDILKMHGFNKDEIPIQEIATTMVPDYIHTFSDGTMIICNMQSKLMWISKYNKIITIPFAYTRAFRFYEKDGQKYVIAYRSGTGYWHYGGGSSWYIKYTKQPDVNFTTYKMNYGETDPEFTTFKTDTVTSVPEAWKADQWLNSYPDNGGHTVVQFEYDVDKNMVVYATTRSGDAPGMMNDAEIMRIELWAMNLNTHQFTDYTSQNYVSTSDYKKTSYGLVVQDRYKDVMLFYSSVYVDSKSSENTSTYKLDASGKFIEAGFTLAFPNHNHGSSGWMYRHGTTPGCFYVNEQSEQIGFTRWEQYRYYSSNTSYYYFFAWSYANWAKSTCMQFPSTTTTYSVSPIYENNVLEFTTQNAPFAYKFNYKYNNRLYPSSTGAINILAWKSFKAQQPNTVFIHSMDTIDAYQVDVEISVSNMSFQPQNILFKDSDGNILPHFMHYRQPSNTRLYVVKMNLKKGWNEIYFFDGGSNTSNGNNVFEEFYDLRKGFPQGWTIPPTSSSCEYRIDPVRGLIGGRLSGTQNAWIDTNKKPEIGMRYEIEFQENPRHYRSGYYQFGQMTRIFTANDDRDNLDGVRCQNSYRDGSPSRENIKYRYATMDMYSASTVLGKAGTQRGDSEYESGDSVVGFEFGKDRHLQYGYMLNGSGVQLTGFTGRSTLMEAFGPYVPSTLNGYGSARTPNTTETIKFFSTGSKQGTSSILYGQDVVFFMKRKAWIGETATVGYKNTYAIRTSNKFYMDVPF